MSQPDGNLALAPAARVQQLNQRLNGRLVVVVLLVGLGLSLLGVGHLLLVLRSVLSAVDLALLARLLGVLLLVLIPTAGIYSLIGQFAFWEGWLQGLPLPEQLFAATTPGAVSSHRRYIIYLDGIHQLERDHPPRVSAFLALLEQSLPDDTRLVRGLEAYTVMPVSLAEDAGGAWLWRRLFALQEHHPNALVQFLSAVMVQGNNVIKVGISSDRRYGPILNYELSLKIALRLEEAGFQPDSGSELVLLGYSGGAEMAMGVADYLRRLCRAPVRIVTFCGVFSGNQVLDAVDRITTVVGSHDPVAALGRLTYPGRSSLQPLSYWNQALRRRQIDRAVIAGMNHNGCRGPFSELYRQQVVDQVLAAVMPC